MIYATALFTRNLKHSKVLKEKFKQLSSLEKEKAFQRKTQSALIGVAKAYMRVNRMARSGIVSNDYNMPVVSGDTTNVSNYICIELRNGLKYRAIGDTVFLEKARLHMDEGTVI